MVSIRVIDDHFELENIGDLTHRQIDSYFSSSFIVASGAFAPPTARVLSAGAGVELIDNGPGSTLQISFSGSQVQFSWNEVPSGLIDGSNRIFSFVHVPTAFMLFLNGVKQSEGIDSDFTLAGSTVTFAIDNVPRAGSNIDATYQY